MPSCARLLISVSTNRSFSILIREGPSEGARWLMKCVTSEVFRSGTPTVVPGINTAGADSLIIDPVNMDCIAICKVIREPTI